MKRNYLLTIKAEDRPGLLHLLTGILNRKLIPLKSLTAAPTDIHDIVLVSMEIEVLENSLTNLLHKFENIIEVFAVEAISYEKAICQRAAYFKMNKEFLTSTGASNIGKWGVQIISIQADTVLLAKAGNEAMIRNLYNELEGPYLLGYSQTGLITDNQLIVHDELERISRLVA